jgi:SAM-dependent methyltransferase
MKAHDADAQLSTVVREKPARYGEWWNTNRVGLEWYKSIYEFRAKSHEFFQEWFQRECRTRFPVKSVLEVGCGRGYPYADYFEAYRYTGFDISQKEIDWCTSNRDNPKHIFKCGDFLGAPVLEKDKHDLVFAHAVIDHVYDVNVFLQQAALAARHVIFVTAYRGYFPEVLTHEYKWTDSVSCFHNKISPSEVRTVLLQAGCRAVDVFPVRCDNPYDKVCYETGIVAVKQT